MRGLAPYICQINTLSYQSTTRKIQKIEYTVSSVRQNSLSKYSRNAFCIPLVLFLLQVYLFWSLTWTLATQRIHRNLVPLKSNNILSSWTLQSISGQTFKTYLEFQFVRLVWCRVVRHYVEDVHKLHPEVCVRNENKRVDCRIDEITNSPRTQQTYSQDFARPI